MDAPLTLEVLRCQREELKVLKDEAQSQVVAYELQDEVLAEKEKNLVETQRLRVQAEAEGQVPLLPFSTDTSTVLVVQPLPSWTGSDSGEAASASRTPPHPYSTRTKRKRNDDNGGSETGQTSRSIKRLHTESQCDAFPPSAVFNCGDHAPSCGQCGHCTVPDITPNFIPAQPLHEVVVKLPSSLNNDEEHDNDVESDLGSDHPGNESDDDEDPDDSHGGNGVARDDGQSKRKRSDRSQSSDDDSRGRPTKRTHIDCSSTMSTSCSGFASFASSLPDSFGNPVIHNKRTSSLQGEVRQPQPCKTHEDEDGEDDIHASTHETSVTCETNAEARLCTACSDDLAGTEHGDLQCGHPYCKPCLRRNDQRGEQESGQLACSMLFSRQP